MKTINYKGSRVLNVLKHVLAFLLIGLCAAACDDQKESPKEIDIQPPVITVAQREVNVIGGVEMTIGERELFIDGKTIASWKDYVSIICHASVSLNGKNVHSGMKLNETGTLIISVSDDAGNESSESITLIRKDFVAPKITILINEKNVIAGTTISVGNNQLLFDEQLAANWNDDYTDECKVSLSLAAADGTVKEVTSGTKIKEAGTFVITVRDNDGNATSDSITLVNVAVYGLDSLKQAVLRVDEETNLLNGLSFPAEVELIKMEMVEDGRRVEILEPTKFIPEYPGTCSIILTIQVTSGEVIEVAVDDLTILPLPYNPCKLEILTPAEILPLLGLKCVGDGYEPIEHLRIAEVTRIRDMMWQYGAGDYSVEEYQDLMRRLNVVMANEIPKDYDNYEIIDNTYNSGPSDHAFIEWNILNTIIKYADFKICYNYPHNNSYFINHPENIFIMGRSAGSHYKIIRWRQEYNEGWFKEKNLLFFASGSNVGRIDGQLYDKVCQMDQELSDETSIYFEPVSYTNGINDAIADRHLMASIGTNKIGDADLTIKRSGSKYPVGFHNDVLFAGRIFPYLSSYGEDHTVTGSGNYASSFVNYTNVAMASLCFQIKADTEDVDALLSMLRSTSLTDYIRLDGQTQSLHLINPAGVVKKYLMPTGFPLEVNSGETAELEKGFYKGVVFDIPGAEVNIDGEWIPYDQRYNAIIMSHNPFDLQWRFNSSLCRKMGYASGNTISGSVIAIDDQLKSLNISNEFVIQLK